MKEMQFSAIVMMVMMCSALIVLMPGEVKRDKVINRSRWLMVGALGLIGAQFLVQYTTHLRTMGITQAVLVNLAFFVPASSLMNLTILNLQRQGRLSRFERWVWLGVTLVVIACLAIAVATDRHPMSQLSERVLLTEVCMSVLYAVIQIYYCVLQFRELVRMQAVIENYYDRERQGLTQWMKHAIGVNGLLAVFVPLLIFGPNIIIVGFSLCFFWGIFMMWFCFVRYFTGNAMWRVREAEENAREEKAEVGGQMAERDGLSAETMSHVGQAVERWLASGAHLKAGTTSPMAAEAMKIPRYQLTAWVKASGHQSFTKWMIAQRIEEAKRVLTEHRDWTNEAVADHCGFNRTHFQKIFKQATGMVPSEMRGDYC
jgi:AraC-like DNA-binding protein